MPRTRTGAFSTATVLLAAAAMTQSYALTARPTSSTDAATLSNTTSLSIIAPPTTLTTYVS